LKKFLLFLFAFGLTNAQQIQYPIISGSGYYCNYSGPCYPGINAQVFAGDMGVPKHLTFSMFTGTGLSTEFGNQFWSSMSSSLSRYFPSVSTGMLRNLSGPACTACNWFDWINGNTVFCEPDFALIVAHGQTSGTCSYFAVDSCPFQINGSWHGYDVNIANDICSPTNNTFCPGYEYMYPALNYGYGMSSTGSGNTKWVIQHNCDGLNPSAAENYRQLFRGIHAIFGYASYTNNYGQIPFYSNYVEENFYCTWGCPYHYSSDVYKYFWANMCSTKWTMWDSWCQANQQCSTEMLGLNGLQGIDVACVFLTGYLMASTTVYLQGIGYVHDHKYFDGSLESIPSMYNGLLPPVNQAPYWSGAQLNYKHIVYGNPTYM
jgi:hypothetical protein